MDFIGCVRNAYHFRLVLENEGKYGSIARIGLPADYISLWQLKIRVPINKPS